MALSPDVAFCEVAGMGPEDVAWLDEFAPADGELPPATCESVARVLRAHTSTPGSCWFCIWEGHGSLWSTSHTWLLPDDTTAAEARRYRERSLAQDEFLKHRPLVEAYTRSYFLLRGPLEAACAFEPDGWYLSPNLWWPDDRSWIVVTEVDGYSSYVGGSRDTVAAVVASSELEAIEVPDDVHMDPECYLPSWR